MFRHAVRGMCVVVVAAAIGVAPVLGSGTTASAGRDVVVGGSVTHVDGRPADGVCIGVADAQGNWVALTETLDDGSYVVWTGGDRPHRVHVIADRCADLAVLPARHQDVRVPHLSRGGVVGTSGTTRRWVLTTTSDGD